MLTLGIDTTARNLSVALAADGVLLAETLVTPQAKHSTLLLPMIDELLGRTGFSIARVDRFTAAHGPGSFSGVRVGVSTAKGLAEAAGKPCAGVSTLAAMARNAVLFSGLICCVMDARRGETYSAIFACENQKLRRLTPDMACS
ncbi:MAG: tRNA (adenosine(37)-N6)-threonylcarbamoyltransferase complex dimerization subunit type 1 TsaB, partial [Oscillospiraceae bacterium]|nr:tRNA (adenosine(37)-N6)-threonylcarbamoyltransferase complex dimerization subunit type 1 TsaB [Oscillospiraceae bacterium]